MAFEIHDSKGDILNLYLTSWKFSDGQTKGTLEQTDLGKYQIIYPLTIVNQTENYSESEIFLFKNKFGIKEDHCFNVYINGARGGVIFPIKIYSNPSVLPPHTFSKETENLYRFLYIAYYHLLNAKIINSKPVSANFITSGTSLKIEDFYDEETIVFLKYNGTSGPSTFNIKSVLPGLLKFGFVPIITASDYNDIETFKYQLVPHPIGTKGMLDDLKVNTISSDLQTEKYLDQLFTSSIKQQLPSISKFILLYQVIELLIDKIALDKYKGTKPFSTNTSLLMMQADLATSFRDTYDVIQKIQEVITKSIEIKNELKRINILFNNKCGLAILNYTGLINEINGLIKIKVTQSGLADYVYAIRNRIVHDYHTLAAHKPRLEEDLNKLAIYFEQLICDIVIEYKK